MVPAPVDAQDIRILLGYLDPARLQDLHLEETVGVKEGRAGVSGLPGSGRIQDGTILTAPEGHQLLWQGKPYRGRLEFRKSQDGRFALVNSLPLEDYLYGVLSSEMDPKTWPLEALKAQAVVSRSYALDRMESFERQIFHAAADTQHQVYWGSTLEHDQAWEAVDATRDEALSDREGRILPSFFHSTCGGRTEDARLVWSPEARDDLVGVSDGSYCRSSPNYAWLTAIPEKDLVAGLERLGFETGGRVKTLRFGEITRSSRSQTLKVRSGEGRHEVPLAKLRTVLGPNWIRSTRITRIERKGDRFVLYGQGWGHGVGLCQWGARGMAQRGASYKEILKHYFPKAHLTNIK